MAQQFYEISIRDTEFPMLSENQTRTLIGNTAGVARDKEGRPGIAYCHNVVPTSHGYDSIGFLSIIPAFPSSVTMTDVRVIFGDARSRIYLAWDTSGRIYSLLSGSTTWLQIPDINITHGIPFISTENITVGTVNGISYIFYSNQRLLIYNETTNELDIAVTSGLAEANMIGVVASSGYLIAYTKEAVAWSSTIDPLDFVPSSVTGAGGGNIAGIDGEMVFITKNTLGILIYSNGNIVAGTYTGNAQFPFKFREVDNSEGGLSLDKVAYESNSPQQFAFSKAGIQAITSQRSETILPDVTDFLSGKRFEDFNEATNQYEITDLSSGQTMLKKVKLISARYLVISYGVTSFTHALVYDLGLQKLGKIKIDHTDCFEYLGTQDEIAKETIAFLAASGEVKVVDFSATANKSGVIILGKVQFSRTRLLTMLGVEIENIDTGDTLEVLNQVSLDGKTFTNSTGYEAYTEEGIREYTFRDTGKNHSLIFKGGFSLVTALVRFTSAGRR